MTVRIIVLVKKIFFKVQYALVYSQCQPGGVTVPTTTVSTPSAPTTTTTTTTAAPQPTSTSTGPIIVLPLGDSITWGMGSNDGNAYRKQLKDSLTAAGITTDFIGTQKNGNMPDNDNQGHSGATIDQIKGYAATALGQKPEVRPPNFFNRTFQSVTRSNPRWSLSWLARTT